MTLTTQQREAISRRANRALELHNMPVAARGVVGMREWYTLTPQLATDVRRLIEENKRLRAALDALQPWNNTCYHITLKTRAAHGGYRETVCNSCAACAITKVLSEARDG